MLVGEPAGGRQEDRDREEVGGQRQLQVDRTFAEIGRDRGKRRGKNRRIEVLHEQRAGNDERQKDTVGHGGMSLGESEAKETPALRVTTLLVHACAPAGDDLTPYI